MNHSDRTQEEVARDRQATSHPFEPAPEHEFCAWCAGPEDLLGHTQEP